MGRELCFCIDEKELYLDLALCTDMDVLDYVVVQLSVPEVSELLHGRIPMRDAILHQEGYWEVISGDEISMDVVKRHSIGELDQALLPEEAACFEALTEELEGYIGEFDKEYQKEEGYGNGIPYIDVSLLTAQPSMECVVLPAFNINEMLRA